MFQKVKDEKEGFRVLREYLKTNRPSWLKRKRAHYPDLEDVRKAIKKAKTQKKKKKSYSFCSSSSSSESESSVHSDSSSNNEDSSDDDSSSDDPSSSSVSSSSDEESDESESSSSNSSSDSSHGRARKRSHKKKRAKHSKKRSKKSHKSKKNKKKKNKKAKKKPRFKLTSQMTKRSRTDESVGESRKLFGVSINNHRTLLEELAPSNAGSKGAKVIMEQIDDFTAFPRVQGKKSNSNTEEFRNLTEALTGTVQFWNGNNDNNYNDISRNVLGKISKEKTDDSFQNLATKLSKKHHSLLDAFKANIAAVLEFVYRITSDQSEYLAEQTLVFKIGQDTLNNYMSLLNYHVGLLNTWTWPQVQVLLKHHAENLWEIRNEFSTRDQVMCRLYTYLRDGAKKNWVSAEVLQEQLVRHRTREDPGGGNENRNGSSGGGAQGGDNGNGDDGSGTTNLGGGSNCSHCRTCCIHHGGKAKCPWKDLSKNKAVEGANKLQCYKDISLVTSTGTSEKIEKQQQRLSTYGTIFCGAPLCTDYWTSRTLKFHIDDSVRSDQQEYKNNYFRTNYKKLPEVDILIYYETNDDKASQHFWNQWDTRKKQTKMIIVVTPESQILVDEGNKLKRTTRFLRHRGYNITTSLIEGEKCGSSLYDRYMISVCQLEKQNSDAKLHFGEHYEKLETRGCFNVIRNYDGKGLPRLRYVKNPILAPTPSCPFDNLLGYYKKEPVFSTAGGIGGYPGEQWIEVEGKGIRRVTIDEWKKLKGFNKHDTYEISNTGILRSISGNIWTSIQNCIEDYECRSTATTIKPEHETPLSTESISSTLDTKESNWTWEPPPLDEKSAFRAKALKRLEQALLTFPPDRREELQRDGLHCLDLHQHNYGPGGFKKIELLWYMWPHDHWYELAYGVSMNFIEDPEPGFIPNQKMQDKDKAIATKFLDELIELGVYEECEESDITNNFPLFVVPKPKPEQKGEFRCIANGRTGGQNDCCVPDPVQMTSPSHILGRMYQGGYSSMLDMSKYFHNFRTVFEEQKYMGVIHPTNGKFYRYVKCPMGSRNSPGGTGRFGMAFLRAVIDSDDIFSQEKYVENTCYNMFDKSKPVYHPEHGEGRVYYSSDGTPAILLWLHVDDLLVHGPSMEKVELAMSKITTMAMEFGMVMQPVKAVLPSQKVQYCGFVYNTEGIPKLEIPSYKLSRALAMVNYILSGSYTRLARLTLATVLGNLQSLVPATQANIGACYLRHLYTDLHSLKDTPLVGCKMYYYTSLELSRESQLSLLWWQRALELGFSRSAYPQNTGTMAVTFGDGSASGAGGTFGMYSESGPHLPKLEFWSGVWDVCVHHYSSNWRELRTLELTLLRELNEYKETGLNRLKNKRVFYFTDNSVTYDVCNNSTSTSEGLMQLIMNIRLLELQLGCQLVVIHVPGLIMISQGTDGLSRGILPDTFTPSPLHHPMQQILRPARASYDLLSYTLQILNLPPDTSCWNFHTDTTSWTTSNLIHQSNFWCISPQLGRQAVLQATYSYWKRRTKPHSPTGWTFLPCLSHIGFSTNWSLCMGCNQPQHSPTEPRHSCMFCTSGFKFNKIKFTPCQVWYHPECVRIGPPFKTRLFKKHTTQGMQYPPKLAGYPFICELCTVRVHLSREVDPLNANDRKLLALERSRIIDLAHGWASSTLNTYLRLLKRHTAFRQQFDLSPLPLPDISHPPYDENIILFWQMEDYTSSLSKKAKSETPKFNSARAFRSALSAYSTLCAALCTPQHTFKDRDLRLLTLPAVGPTDTISATMIAHGMAVRLGTHSQSSMALFQRHIHRNQDLRLEALSRHGLTPIACYGLVTANCVELLGFLGWLRGTEVFSLRREDLEIIKPEFHLLHDLPPGVGCLLFTLLPSTKSSQTDFVDIVLAYKTSGGLRPGFWFEYLLELMDVLGWSHPTCYLFRHENGEQWTSGFFRTTYLFPFLSLQREEGDIHFRTIDDTPENSFAVKFYSFHTFRISGNTHSLRKRDGCTRRATPIERVNHGRWRVKYRGIESMPMHYQQPSVNDLVQITLHCF